jgi:myo-inositol 2-dehydrogenase/D-chiro-inositol 1-dehydrogenase
MHKIALIGAGRIGRIHGANVVAHPRLTLSHIVDRWRRTPRRRRREMGAAVADLEAVLADASVAGVIVASSTDTHLDYSVRAHAAGKAVFCEKPIDMDLGRARPAAEA